MLVFISHTMLPVLLPVVLLVLLLAELGVVS
jgi:hypothetical protein